MAQASRLPVIVAQASRLRVWRLELTIMNKRIRKKHRVGEFTEWGFAATFTLADAVTGDAVHEFLDLLAVGGARAARPAVRRRR